jgi:hypothetical protein
MIRLGENWRPAETKARELGLDTPVATEAMRNPGDRRTEEKRQLLTSIGERAAAQGLQPLPARYEPL